MSSKYIGVDSKVVLTNLYVARSSKNFNILNPIVINIKRE